MIDYSLALCYGIIVSADKMEELKEALTDEEYDEVMDNYSRCINSWTGEDYFVGVMVELTESVIDFVYHISESEFTISDDDEDLIDFWRFFSEHDLWKFIDWKPELLLINFCH